jgi:hypothetical protein
MASAASFMFVSPSGNLDEILISPPIDAWSVDSVTKRGPRPAKTKDEDEVDGKASYDLTLY